MDRADVQLKVTFARADPATVLAGFSTGDDVLLIIKQWRSARVKRVVALAALCSDWESVMAHVDPKETVELARKTKQANFSKHGG